MGFSAKQVQALRRKLDGRQIRTREANGRELSYIEGWYAISEANRIFGFDGWSRETIRLPLRSRSGKSRHLSCRLCRQSADYRPGRWGNDRSREGHGSGEGRGTSPGEVHDIALKAAETDATKRAFATFGKPFGLELYRQGRTSANLPPASGRRCRGDPFRFSPRRYDANSAAIALLWPSSKSTAPPAASRPQPNHERRRSLRVRPLPRQDRQKRSCLAEPKRRRDKSHLRFVASQPCLVCGRHPSDPHHLRFAQPRALGVKVSDEFTVPLCRGHHRQLHQTGNEVAWWENLKIDALRLARQLWEQTHPNEGQGLATTPPSDVADQSE